MPARQDRQKVHHGRRKKGSRIRRRLWAINHNKKVRSRYSKRHKIFNLSLAAKLSRGIR